MSSSHVDLLFLAEGRLDEDGLEQLRLLAKAKQTVNSRRKPVLRPDGLGLTPLMAAMRRGDERAAALLVEEGADVNAQEEWGRTALMLAVEHGHGEMPLIGQLLGARKVNIDLQDHEGDGLLSYLSLIHI